MYRKVDAVAPVGCGPNGIVNVPLPPWTAVKVAITGSVGSDSKSPSYRLNIILPAGWSSSWILDILILRFEVYS